MNIINYLNATKEKDFIDCRIRRLRDYFSYNNLNLDIYDVFILGKTIDCALLKFKYEKDHPYELYLLGASNHEIEQDLFEFLGINYIPSEIKENGSQHPKKIKIDDFEKMINSQTFPLQVNPYYSTIAIDQNNVEEINLNHTKLLWEALRKTCESMLIGNEMVLDNTYEYKYISFGLHNLQEIIRINNELKEMLLDRKITGEVKLRFFKLYSRKLREMLMQGSNYCYRKEFGESLVAMSRKLDESRLKNIGVQFKNISRLWIELTNTLLFNNKDIKSENIYRSLNKANSLIEEIYNREYKLFNELYILTHFYVMNVMV